MLVILFAALLASYLPAWRASRAAPTAAPPAGEPRSLMSGVRPLRAGRGELAHPLDVRQQRFRFFRAQFQVRHPHAVVLGKELAGDGVAGGEHHVRRGDVAREPGAIAPAGDVEQVRPYAV